MKLRRRDPAVYHNVGQADDDGNQTVILKRYVNQLKREERRRRHKMTQHDHTRLALAEAKRDRRRQRNQGSAA